MGDLTTLREAYEARRLDEAWHAYQAARAGGKAGPEAHFYGGLTARLKGDLPRARMALEEGLGAGAAGRVAGQLRMTLGVVLREAGEPLSAIEHLQAWIDGTAAYPELVPVALGAAWYNLGLALRQARRHAEAIQAYITACEAFRRHDLPEHLCKGLHNLAWVACGAGNTPLAAEALDEAEELCRTDELRWHQRVGRAYLEALAGASHSAMELCETITRNAGVAPPAVVSHAYWVAGTVALDLGQFDAARSLAMQAQQWAARASGENRSLHDAGELLRAIRLAEQSEGAGA